MAFRDSERQDLEAIAARARAHDIDPREYGRLEAKVDALESEMLALRSDVRTLLEMANRSRGALWVGMGFASVIGGMLTAIGSHLWTR